MDNRGIIWASSQKGTFKIFPDQGIHFVALEKSTADWAIKNADWDMLVNQDKVWMVSREGIKEIRSDNHLPGEFSATFLNPPNVNVMSGVISDSEGDIWVGSGAILGKPCYLLEYSMDGERLSEYS